MALRDCIEAQVNTGVLKRRLLSIADDEALTTEVIETMQAQRKNLVSNIKSAKIRIRGIEELEEATRPGWINPKKLVHDPIGAMMDMVSGSYRSLEATAAKYVTEAHMTLDKGLRAAKVMSLKGRWFARSDEKWMRDVSIALHGGSVENVGVATFGKEYQRIMTNFVERINAAGGNIPVKKNYGLPHYHAPDKVAKDFAQWKKDVVRAFDIPVKPGETLDDILESSWKNITDHKRTGSGMGRSFQRQWEAKSGESWYEYNLKYGENDVFGIIMKSIHDMSHDLAALERFGPNARETVKHLADKAVGIHKNLKQQGLNVAMNRFKGDRAVDIYDNLMGFTSRGSQFVASAGQGLRVAQIVTKLGLSPVTAITDVGFTMAAAHMNRMPVLKTLKTQLVELATQGDREFLSQLGVISDVVVDDVQMAHRFGDVAGNGFAVKVADAYTKAIGLHRWTRSMKVGFTMELNAHMTKLSKKTYNDLTDGMREVLARYGIDRGAWSHIRKAELAKHKGAKFLDPSTIPDEEVRRNFTVMLQTEARYAVPEASARSRAALNFGKAPGTLAGELSRTATQFKSFPVSVVQMQLARVRSLPTNAARAHYTSKLLAGSTVLGAMSLWIKDLLNGRDPSDITPSFAFKSLVHGGATGPMGDLFQSVGEYGGSVADFLAGPTFGGLFNVIAMSPKELLSDDKTLREYGGQLSSKSLKQLGQSASYGKILFNRYLLDGLSEYVDPTLHRRRTRQIRDAARKGKTMYWRPGDTQPSRMPEIPEFKLED